MTVPTKLLTGIEKLSIDDLKDLNNRVVRLIRAKRDAESAVVLATLRTGQKCEIFCDGTWIEAQIRRIAIKKITVEVTDKNSYRKGHQYLFKPIPEIFRTRSKAQRKAQSKTHGTSKKLSPQKKAWQTRRKRQQQSR